MKTYRLEILRETPGRITARYSHHGLTRKQLTSTIVENRRVAGPISHVEVWDDCGEMVYAGSADDIRGKRLN